LPGLSGILAGVKLCPEAHANAGTCSPESEVGETTLSVGLGADPYTVTGGKVYLTEGYDGAPFGLSIVSPAKVGPFDLQEGRPIVIRAKLEIDPATGEFAGHGASLHVTVTTAPGQANMRSLKLDLPQRLPARLETVQKACPEGTFDANPAACPKASVVGSAIVQTPVLSAAMVGPAYLVAKEGPGAGGSGASAGSPGATSSKGAAGTSAGSPEAAFPDIVLVLQAQGVTIDLTGALFVSEKNITSATFKTIPDIPIRRLDLILPEGARSILAAGGSLCKRPLHMSAAATGQNGARVKRGVRVAVSGCKRHRRRPARHAGGKAPAEAFDRGTLGAGMRAAIEEVEHGYEEMIDGWRRA
jgi:hypothetical protein